MDVAGGEDGNDYHDDKMWWPFRIIPHGGASDSKVEDITKP